MALRLLSAQRSAAGRRRGGPSQFKPGGRTVNKNDLVAQVADAAGLSRGDAAKAVDAVLESITEALKAGDEVRLVGFGTFAVSERKAGEARNPRTGEKVEVAASRQPKFKAGKALKDALN